MAGRMLRPRAVVLPDSALLAGADTHEVVAAQPYYRAAPKARSVPAGSFAKGTKVRMIAHAGGPMCRVALRDGKPVYTAYVGLRELAGVTPSPSGRGVG